MTMVAWLPPPPLCPPQPLPTWGRLFTLLVHLVPGGSFVDGTLTTTTMTITMMRIKPTRMTLGHLRVSDSSSGFAMTLTISTRLEERTMTLMKMMREEGSPRVQLFWGPNSPSRGVARTMARAVAVEVATAVALASCRIWCRDCHLGRPHWGGGGGEWTPVASPPMLHCC
jgi:hypothetical protein